MSDQTNTAVARLCHIIQWKSFDGYGFNLHAEKGKPGQFIGKVDEGSPAEAAGLKQGDSIIEVNGVNIADENHKQVVQRIKAIPNETKLLVVDSEADKYFKANKIIVESTMPNILHLKTPEDPKLVKEINGDKQAKNATEPDAVSQASSAGGTSPTLSAERSASISTDETVPKSNGSNGAGPEGTKTLERNSINSSLNLNMTAKELRAQLASRKKYDPKKDALDFKKKHDIIQKL